VKLHFWLREAAVNINFIFANDVIIADKLPLKFAAAQLISTPKFFCRL
jgi:hypothetical protein